MKGNPGQFKRGNQSAKGHGRPSGKGRRQSLLEAIGQKGLDDLIKTILDAALTGDMQAAALLLNRIIPSIRPVSPTISIPMDGDLLQKAEAIIDAAASGSIPASEAKALLDGIGQVARIKELVELEKRIEALEGKFT